MVRRLQRQLPFLRSVLREADQNVRRERLQHANADQVNAISELVMNTLKGNVEVPPRLLDQLRPRKRVARDGASQTFYKTAMVRHDGSKPGRECGTPWIACVVIA